MSIKRYAVISLHLPENEFLEVSGTVRQVLSHEQLGNSLHPDGHRLTILVEEDV